MKFSSEEVISKINSDFTKVYKPQSKFPGSGAVWNECINTINDAKLMNNIIFCNDIMKIPPVKTFLMANTSIISSFSDTEKKSIGAFWGFVFKFVFGYTQQKNDVPINTKGIKKAAYFYDVKESIEIENEGNNKCHKYKEYIDIKNIVIDASNSFRYLLTVPYLDNKSDRSALVIMKNPSKADKTISDHTINNVLKFCEGKYSKVYFMNLFPFYSTDPLGVKEFIKSKDFEKIMKKNDEVLKATIHECDDVIVAWGRDSIGNKEAYLKAIQRIEKIIDDSEKTKNAVKLKGGNEDKQYPWHPQVWAVNNELELYKWDNKN